MGGTRMGEFVSTITGKGRVTIPAEVRRALGVAAGDRIAFVIEGERVSLRRAGGVVERTAGVIETAQPAETAEALRAAAERAIAEEAVARARL
ncbi:MAG TPA: AbrB/MazE/SpoVT family DNA-binding domain-containing protein [Thermomicrobiales bacterium]|nr:AbrB/MazE/SpoVT family DNA-binding domain-containing protein [Thermomicrobiales bacterium]